MKVQCKYCGRPNRDENDLCLSCGAPLPVLVENKERPDYFNWCCPSLNVSGSFSYLDKWSLQLLEAQNE